MHYSKIEARKEAFDLFNVERNPIGGGRTGEGPRKATDREVKEYLFNLALRDGPHWPDHMEIQRTDYRRGYESRILGATFGAKLGNATTAAPAQYECGAYSIPMPGRNAHRDTVTMETLNDAGEVIASQTLPVDPKKGGIIWDKATVQKAVGKIEKPRRGKMAAPAKIPDAMEQDPAPVHIMPPEAATTPGGPGITPAEPVSNRDELAEQVSALAAMVEETRGQIKALSVKTVEQASPVEGMTAVPPISGKQRTAAHERAIRSYLKMRKERDHKAKYARLWYLEWQKEHGIAGQAKLKRRQAVLRALELRAKLRKQEAVALDRLRHVRDLSAEVVALKGKPHHMGQAVRPDDYQRLVRERDEARASLTSESEKLRIMRANLERGTDALNMMTDRALRAENALRAVEQRQARANTPYHANVRAVTFGRVA